jgi:hypothetical protein
LVTPEIFAAGSVPEVARTITREADYEFSGRTGDEFSGWTGANPLDFGGKVHVAFTSE